MFDSYIVNPTETKLVPYEKTVIEKRAPTDESIKLWDEMKDKAFKALVDTMEIKNNLINMDARIFRDLYLDNLIVAYRCIINGITIEGRESIKYMDIFKIDRSEIFKLIFKRVSESLTEQLLETAIKHNPQFLEKY